MLKHRSLSQTRLTFVILVTLAITLAGMRGSALARSSRSPEGQTIATRTTRPSATPRPTVTPSPTPPATPTSPTATPRVATVPPTAVPPLGIPPSANGVAFVPGQSSALSLTGGGACLEVPGDAIEKSGTFLIVPVDQDAAPPPPDGFRFSGLIVDVLFYDSDGNLVEHLDFGNAITLCFDVSDEQMTSFLNTDPHDPDIWVYNTESTPNEWQRLPGTFVRSDTAPGKIFVNLNHITLYALLQSEQLQVSTGTPKPQAGAAATSTTEVARPTTVRASLLWIIAIIVSLIIVGVIIYAVAGRRREPPAKPPTGAPPSKPRADKMPPPKKPGDKMPEKKTGK